MKIPIDVRREVISEIYRRLDAMNWEECSPSECSRTYVEFLNDPLIGGRLDVFMPRDRVRIWIKDGPAKEYRRALEGIGPYQGYTSRRSAGAETVVRSALGSEWSVVYGSIVDKPMRCVAECGDSLRPVVWGPESSLKELIWHAALHAAERPGQPAMSVVITRRGNAPIDMSTWQRATRLAKVVGCEVCQIPLLVTETTPDKK